MERHPGRGHIPAEPSGLDPVWAGAALGRFIPPRYLERRAGALFVNPGVVFLGVVFLGNSEPSA